ncbi:YbaN family protein [Novosphingobium sp.]|uniref:YbaN family protein n=1 Tax=Novosphingobium sp. TaxID=1874826 RepID=UPI001ECB204E|nr:YbaN family protein [Novosphingobium sp.]MBK6802537.1 YbaN family protein [Novosphingobium sp.]MBK9009271.1 YbaN family protein [Novosphingobium sp.]
MNLARLLWGGAGLTALALGAAGVVLPVLPTVPFLLLAAFCFARSNPAWEARLLDHPRWGPPLRQWRERRAISRTAKLAAIGTMAASGVLTAALAGWTWALIPLAVLLIAGSWIWTRPE